MADARGEAGVGGGGFLAVIIKTLEGILATEQPRLGEGEQAPKIEQPVFDGRAGEHDAGARRGGARAAWAVALADF